MQKENEFFFSFPRCSLLRPWVKDNEKNANAYTPRPEMIDRKEKNVGGRASEWLFRTALPRCRLTTRSCLVGWFMDGIRNRKRRSRRTARTILVVAVCLEKVCQRYLPSIGFGFDSLLVDTVDGITYRIKITGFTDGKVIVD